MFFILSFPKEWQKKNLASSLHGDLFSGGATARDLISVTLFSLPGCPWDVHCPWPQVTSGAVTQGCFSWVQRHISPPRGLFASVQRRSPLLSGVAGYLFFPSWPPAVGAGTTGVEWNCSLFPAYSLGSWVHNADLILLHPFPSTLKI